MWGIIPIVVAMKVIWPLPPKVPRHLTDYVLLYVVVFERRFRKVLSPLARSHVKYRVFSAFQSLATSSSDQSKATGKWMKNQ